MTKFLSDKIAGQDVADAIQIALEDIGAEESEVLAGLIKVIVEISSTMPNPQAVLDEVVDILMEEALDQ